MTKLVLGKDRFGCGIDNGLEAAGIETEVSEEPFIVIQAGDDEGLDHGVKSTGPGQWVDNGRRAAAADILCSQRLMKFARFFWF